MTIENLLKVGQIVMQKLQNSRNANAYLWGSDWIPLRIMEEYPNFYVAEVLPHLNPKGSGESVPYRVTIDKRDILTGEIIVKEVDKNELRFT